MKKLIIAIILMAIPMQGFCFPAKEEFKGTEIMASKTKYHTQQKFQDFNLMKCDEGNFYISEDAETGYSIIILKEENMLDSRCVIYKTVGEGEHSLRTYIIEFSGNTGVYFSFNEGRYAFCPDLSHGFFQAIVE